MSRFEEVNLVDASGNDIDSHLSGDGTYHLGVATTINGNQNPERNAWVTPLNALAIAPDYRLVGTSFSGTVKDTNFWTETVANGGTVTRPGGYVILQTNTTADATVLYETVAKGRFVSGYPNMFTALPNWETAGTTDNVRRVGCYTSTDGFFVQLDGTTFSVGTRKAGSDTLTTTFNGNMGTTWTPTADTYYKINIEYTPKGVYYYVNGVLLHKNGTALLTNSLTLGVMMENINDNSSTSDVVFNCIAAKISREGQLHTDPTYKYITGATEVVCKYNAGTLHNIVITNNAGTITVYDGVDDTGDVMAVIDALKIQGTMGFDAPFSTGLTIITTGAAGLTVMYE